MKTLLYISAVGVVLCLGCATYVTPDAQQITFNSRPQGAHIQVGDYNGITPCALLIPKTPDRYSIKATYNDQEQIVSLSKKPEWTGIWNFFLTGGIGFIPDAITGKIQKYGPTDYMFDFTDK